MPPFDVWGAWSFFAALEVSMYVAQGGSPDFHSGSQNSVEVPMPHIDPVGYLTSKRVRAMDLEVGSVGPLRIANILVSDS